MAHYIFKSAAKFIGYFFWDHVLQFLKPKGFKRNVKNIQLD